MVKLKELKRGDIITNKLSGNGYVVTGNYGNYVTAVNTISIYNESEWDVWKQRSRRVDDHI